MQPESPNQSPAPIPPSFQGPNSFNIPGMQPMGPENTPPLPSGKPSLRGILKKIMWTGAVIFALLIIIPIGLLVLSFIQGDPFFNKQNSIIKCRTLEQNIKPTTDELLKSGQIIGKKYDCGGLHGDPPKQNTSITYFITGAHDPAQTTSNMQQAITQQLSNNGWRNPATNEAQVDYDYVLSKQPAIVANVTVLSPKYNFYRLDVVIKGELESAAEADTTPPKDIPLPSDAYDKYRSYQVFTPTYSPPAYAPWQFIDTTSSSNYSGSITSTFSTPPREGGSISLFQHYYEPELHKVANCNVSDYLACSNTRVGATVEGTPVYGVNPSIDNPEQYRSFVAVIGDTKIEFSWPPGGKPEDKTKEEAIKVIDSLQ